MRLHGLTLLLAVFLLFVSTVAEEPLKPLNAANVGVADKVKFFQQDLFETDIRKATVVTLYLLPEVNRRLPPRLLSDLKPGTRVVSLNHDMGDWKPVKTLTVRAPYEYTISETLTKRMTQPHKIYYWVVPPRNRP
jgi:hypothetical protein